MLQCNWAACCRKLKAFRFLIKWRGAGLGKLPKLSPDISCQHFITAAVIKRQKPCAGRELLNCILAGETNPPQQQQLQPKELLSDQSAHLEKSSFSLCPSQCGTKL